MGQRLPMSRFGRALNLLSHIHHHTDLLIFESPHSLHHGTRLYGGAARAVYRPGSTEARLKLLDSIGKDAVIEVIYRCFELGLSEEVLAQMAPIALDDRAAQSSGATVAQPAENTTRAGQFETGGIQ